MKSLYDMAIINHNCPKCKTLKGNMCRTCNGFKSRIPHIERVKQVTKKDLEINETYQGLM